MNYTRRDLGRIALAALPVAALGADSKPHSVFGGVQIGIIAPYSFRGMPADAESTLKNLLQIGLSSVELQSSMVESFAGAPLPAGGRGRGRGGRGQMTPEQQAAQAEAARKLRDWRLAAPMGKIRELRATYNNAGVSIYAFKIVAGQVLTPEELEYAFNVVEALGADQLTMEIPLKGGGANGAPDDAMSQTAGEIAARRKIMVGYHAHAQAKPPATVWDVALTQSKYNGINFDMGHYVANTNLSAIPFIQKHHDRITSMHVKDRKFNGGPATPFGQGDAQVADVLRLIKKEKYSFPASIEFEYQVPEGSTVTQEIAKCLAFCRDALA
ncbi:MAG: sugar phosphate isomerase/epimerase [Acidobacteriota bacterium]|nr:sugar phosphate isomerase/epimerase [Acidobacteriota bacterium]